MPLVTGSHVNVGAEVRIWSSFQNLSSENLIHRQYLLLFRHCRHVGTCGHGLNFLPRLLTRTSRDLAAS